MNFAALPVMPKSMKHLSLGYQDHPPILGVNQQTLLSEVFTHQHLCVFCLLMAFQNVDYF